MVFSAESTNYISRNNQPDRFSKLHWRHLSVQFHDIAGKSKVAETTIRDWMVMALIYGFRQQQQLQQ